MSVCVSWCLSVCVHDNSKNNDSIHWKLAHIVEYENSSNELDIGHCPIKVKVTILTVKSFISALAYVRKL